MQACNLFVVQRNVETVAELQQHFAGHLLLLVGDVLTLARLAHAVALYRLGEYHGRLPGVLGGRGIRCEHLVCIMTATVQAPYFRVGHIGDHFQQFRIFSEEVLAHIRAILGFIGLIIAVHRFLHALLQQAMLVLGEQTIPLGTPYHLDHVPSGAAEHPFQFLDDLAVAAHRTIEPLQIAVDHEDQVVELLAPGH